MLGKAKLGQLAKVVTLPAEMEPIRFPSPTMGTDQTALFHLTTTGMFEFNGNLDPASMTFTLTGSPISPVWGNYTTTAPRTYTWEIGYPTTKAKLYSVTDGNSQPCFPARYNDTYWIYVPAGLAVTMHAANFSGAGTANVSAQIMGVIGDINDAEAFVVTIGAGGTGSLAVAAETNSYWINIVSATSTVLASGATITIEAAAASNGFWPVVTCPSISAVSPAMSNMRVNCSALLLTNVSKALYKNGAVTAARIVGRDTNIFTDILVADKITTANERLRYSGEASRGCYTFYLPTQETLSFSDYVGVYRPTFADGGPLVPIVYDLMDFAHVNAVAFSVDATNGFNLKFRHDMHLEFRSDAQIFNLDIPLLSLDEFYAVVTAASRLVPFTENPIHIGLLSSLAKKVLGFLAPILIPHAQRAITYGANRANQWLEERR